MKKRKEGYLFIVCNTSLVDSLHINISCNLFDLVHNTISSQKGLKRNEFVIEREMERNRNRTYCKHSARCKSINIRRNKNEKGRFLLNRLRRQLVIESRQLLQINKHLRIMIVRESMIVNLVRKQT